MKLNLEADPGIQVFDPMLWTPLQIDVTISIANAQLREFEAQAMRLSDMVRVRVLTVATAADVLQQAADYNALPSAYGQDCVQAIMAAAFAEAA